jgi:type I restriction enzyme S subunit
MNPNPSSLITDHLDTWTSAIKAKSTAGRGSAKNQEFYGIKKLRELILELAVRGLLVPQDAKDEPAAELLKKIAGEKSKLIKAGKIKKGKKFPLPDEELAFIIPPTWAWTTLGEISEIGPRNTLPDDIDAGFVPMPLISTSYDGAHGQEIKTWGELKKGYTHFANGDIAIAKITPCFENSKAAIFRDLENGHGAGTTELHVARLIGGFVNSRFILLYLKAPMFLEKGKPKMTGSAGQKRIPASYFANNSLPLPPLAEQHRIVAKVDELMALCDQLEQQQEDSVQTHSTLVQTLLGALTAASERGAFAEAWQRIASHFDTLFTTESSIDQLKQTILQLAVIGKLVEQDRPHGAAPMVSMEELVGRKNLKNGLSLSPINGPSDFVCLPLSSMKGDTIDCSVGKPIEIGPDRAKPYLIKEGDVFIIRGNGSKERVGVAGMARACPPNVLFPDLFIRVPLPPAKIDSNFFLIAWNSHATREKLECLATTTSGIWKVNQGHISECEIPLPPLAEQHRIVAKVDELMALCDRLKANLQSAKTTQLHLADTLVEAAIR